MSNEQNFKKGDRVRFKGDYAHYAESALEAGKEYTVVSADEYGCDLSVQCTAYSVGVEDLELIEHLDRRTAFLSRLQSLMSEYDASFYFYDVYDMEIRIGEESVEYSFLNKENSPSLTADNIMDFDKE